MGDLATHLGFQVGRALGRPVDAGYFQPRVVDKTGLPGTYSFILEYDCPGCVAPAAPPTVDADGGGGFARLAPVPGDFPDLFGALKRQLGLKLVKTKDVVVDIIVVESVDRTPTEN
ncbi:MAG: hypothetical protein JWN34_3881 [Bryobacterales bacterium]|nr:hypothetical protein [Bryobacterales bacterium]